ncbi:MAG TPA: hypothetical protein VK013_16060 [Myxococcaceae bacterium]|nr:hypothetical protein [Myxococcaceae bacterium]
MADKRRFDLFAELLLQRFPETRRVYDVAGGMGRLNRAFLERGRSCLTFDLRHKRLPVEYAERLFTLEEPCDADLVVGLHADGATRLVIEYAARHRVGFAVVPCCSDNGMPYKPWMRHLTELAQSLGFTSVTEEVLPMAGRARVIVGSWSPEPGV